MDILDDARSSDQYRVPPSGTNRVECLAATVGGFSYFAVCGHIGRRDSLPFRCATKLTKIIAMTLIDTTSPALTPATSLLLLMNDAALNPTDRSTLRRRRERGSDERTVIHAILDEAMICHVGSSDGQSVYVVPMAYAAIGERLYVHGAAANHLLRTLAAGGESCVTVTILDGLVLARSAFHHSMNYRSVMLYGRGEEVTDPTEKRSAVIAIIEHLVPGRSEDARPPTDVELLATTVVCFPIDEGSAKVRTGPPIDDAEDLELPIWAGVLPISTIGGAPIVDTEGVMGIATPRYAIDHQNRKTRT